MRASSPEKPSTRAAAPGASPSTAPATSSAAWTPRPRARACASSRSMVASPMPRAGTLTMRKSETSSRRVGQHLEVGHDIPHLALMEEFGSPQHVEGQGPGTEGLLEGP